jgi:hypothetical protein
MKKILFIIFAFFITSVKGQYSWEFENKLYVIDSIGNIDIVFFGNDSSATLGVDTNLLEQNIIGFPWDSLEIRSIHRTSDSVDCPIDYWQMGNIFIENIDLKKDIRTSIETWSSMFFVFKIHAINYPIEIYSDFNEMFANSKYNGWTVILKHQYECNYDEPATCVPNYQYLFTIMDSTERYITIRFDYVEDGILETTNTSQNLIVKNPVDKLLTLNYNGLINIYDVTENLIFTANVNRDQPIDIGFIKPGLYIIRTQEGAIKMIKY